MGSVHKPFPRSGAMLERMMLQDRYFQGLEILVTTLFATRVISHSGESFWLYITVIIQME
jgi:hypothetical protein